MPIAPVSIQALLGDACVPSMERIGLRMRPLLIAMSCAHVQACFKEALRLFPPGHITVREAVEDLTLAGHFIPKGTWLHVRPPPDSLFLTTVPAPIMQHGRGRRDTVRTGGPDRL